MDNNNIDNKELLSTSIYFDNKSYIDVKTEDGVTTKSYTYSFKNAKGELVTKCITDIKTIETFSALDKLFAMSKLSVMGICIECGNLTLEQAKALGFKTISACLSSKFDLNTTTINKYRRISRLFGKRTIDENGQIHYDWKNGIPTGTSVTNLDCVMALANLPADADSLTDDEITKIYSDFVNTYVLSEKVHLLLPNKELRDEIKALNNTLEAVEIKEITSNQQTSDQQTSNQQTSDQQTSNQQTSDQQTSDQQTSNQQTGNKEIATSAINTLATIFNGNKDVAKALTVIVKAIEKLD